MKLIQPLFSGSIDVIGDVHGEFGALRKLTHLLGYSASGHHPEGRKMVFIGDLVDRGPNSIAVANWVQHLIQNGRAQCVAGNHELNILRTQQGTQNDQMRHGNHWYFGHEEALDPENDGYIHPQQLASPSDQAEIHRFFLELPLVLEDDSYRMVHAACNTESFEQLQAYDAAKIAPTAQESDRHILHAYQYFAQKVMKDTAQIEDRMTKELAKQNSNPVKVCTSGLELAAEAPYYIKGKMRYTKRQIWWQSYHGEQNIIFGHYWRRLPPSIGIETERFIPLKERSAPDPFKDIPHDKWLGSSMCIDYSVGGRYYDRQQNIEEGHTGKSLCALRITRSNHEKGHHELWFDTGQRITPN